MEMTGVWEAGAKPHIRLRGGGALTQEQLAEPMARTELVAMIMGRWLLLWLACSG